MGTWHMYKVGIMVVQPASIMAVVWCSSGSGDGAGMYRFSQGVKSCGLA